MALKRFFGRLILVSRGPLAFLWRVLVHPTLFYCYRGGRLFKKWLIRAMAPARSWLNIKYIVHVLVIFLSFVVVSSNIQAREQPTISGSLGQHSILSRVSGREMEDLVVEEAGPVEFVKEVSYLGAQAIRPKAESLGQVMSGNGDPATDLLIESLPPSIILNAVRVQTDLLAADESVRTRTQVIEHIVEAGENVGSIAHRYNLQTNTILVANDLSARSVIRPGQKLRILPVDGILYTVKKGDTILSIANKYKSTAEQIMEFNDLADAGALSIGQSLILPGGKLPAPAPAPAPALVTTNLRQVFSPATGGGSGRLLWPTSARRITQYYKRSHLGVDIAGPVGTPIYAADDGVVTFSSWNNGGYGRMVIIDHGNGLHTRYAHASRNLVQNGDVVKRGDVIQLMGSTGRSTGSHIHFEVLSGGIYNRVNPFDYIQ